MSASGIVHNISLSRGSLQKILDGHELESATLQILGYKKVPGGGLERFRLLLNDGTLLFSFAILATQLNSLIKEGKLEKYTVFKLNKYACPLAQPDKKIILCLDVTPLVPGSQINNQIDYLKTTSDDGLDTIKVQSMVKSKVNTTAHTISQNIAKSGNQYLNSNVGLPSTSLHSQVVATLANQSIAHQNMSSLAINRTTTLSRSSFQLDNVKSESNISGNFNVAKATSKVYFADKSESNFTVTAKSPTVAKFSNQNQNSNIRIRTNFVVGNPPVGQNLACLNKYVNNINLSASISSNIPVTKSLTPSIVTQVSNNSAVHSNWHRDRLNPSTNAQNLKPVVPIMSLTPYQNKWTIKVRVIYKTSITSYSNDKRSGKLFSFYLIDESGEIKATAFNNDAEHLFSFLQLDKVYYISAATVRLSRSSPAIHDFELTVNSNTKIEQVDSNDLDTPELKFNFVPINEISNWINNFIDVIGVCVGTEIRNIVIKSTNREVAKLDVRLMDMDENKINVSIWGNEAEGLNLNNFPVVAFKRVKVTDFNGCSLSMTQSSLFFINPNVTQTNCLRAWFNENSACLNLDNPTNTFERSLAWKSVAEITNLDISNTNLTDYSTVKATIVMVQKDNALYRACSSNDCFKKVIMTPMGQYHCNKCNKDFDSFSWTLMLKISLADFSSDVWTVAFRETAESILKLKTADLSIMKEQNEEKFFETLSDLNFKSFIFKLRSRSEVFNDTNQLKVSIIDVSPVDSVSYTKKLLSDINCFENILNND